MDRSILPLRSPRIFGRPTALAAPLCLALLVTLSALPLGRPSTVRAQDATPPPAATPGASPVAAPAGPPATAARPNTDGWHVAETAHFAIFVQPNDAVDAEMFAAAYAGYAERAHDELISFFGVDSPGRLAIYAYVDGAAFELARQTVTPRPLLGTDAVADPGGRAIHLFLTSFLGRSAREADGALRNAVAVDLLWLATNSDILPLAFTYGMAYYAERPPSTRLARVAAMVADATGRNDPLLRWFELNRAQSIQASPELAASLAYSVAAFLIDRQSVRTFQTFLDALTTETDWRPAMERAYGRKAEVLEQQWREFLPRWIAGDWRENLVAAFDLEPARKLFAEARYAEAKTLLESSQLLYADLGDRERLTEVQDLLLQCDTGLQAEALMLQAQEALEHHTYDRAQALLLQARAQYERLPEEHRPTELLALYEQLAADGLAATTSLEEAQRLGRSWGDYPEARSAALTAGTTFAHLGDEEMVARSEAVIADLDARQRRLVLMLGALAALTGAWLALWLWARGRPDLRWR